MEKEIVKEICKDLNWKERILVFIHKKLVLKMFDLTREYLVNKIM